MVILNQYESVPVSNDCFFNMKPKSQIKMSLNI